MAEIVVIEVVIDIDEGGGYSAAVNYIKFRVLHLLIHRFAFIFATAEKQGEALVVEHAKFAHHHIGVFDVGKALVDYRKRLVEHLFIAIAGGEWCVDALIVLGRILAFRQVERKFVVFYRFVLILKHSVDVAIELIALAAAIAVEVSLGVAFHLGEQRHCLGEFPQIGVERYLGFPGEIIVLRIAVFERFLAAAVCRLGHQFEVF